MGSIPLGDMRRDLAAGDLRGELRDRELIVGERELCGSLGERDYASTFFPPS
ncbi:MAG: hypothetical protein ACRENA_07325 [Vulcanimicrobiaceae bacterium]